MTELRAACRAVLEASWRPADGFCPPNPTVYPHQWLWDSCFHAIAWAALGDGRGVTELESCLRSQLPTGFVPHMRYLGPTVGRGPLPDRSSYTQPPVYAHAARVLRDAGFGVPAQTVTAIGRALECLWRDRRTDAGLVYLVHPWESGADDSPRWDSWIGLDAYDRDAYRTVDRRLVDDTVYDEAGAATWSRSFVAAPAAFNALVAHAFGEFAQLTGDAGWADRRAELVANIDRLLWDDASGLWRDLAIIGGGESVTVPTLDGAMPLLVTRDPAKADRVLDQLRDPARFAAPYGLRYVWPDHASYDPDAYWRGPAWPQLNYLMWLAVRRWDRSDLAAEIARSSRVAATRSGFAEFWNPETGAGRGAIPQGWAALAAVYR
jgi:hypothetical protein